MMEPSFQVQGWCPGALRPMMSGDGLVVRVRPQAGRLTQTQAAGVAAAARTHGNALIDLSARGNVQLRGVSMASHSALIADLRALGLIDAYATDEARRNVLVTPFADAATDALAARLGRRWPGCRNCRASSALSSIPAPRRSLPVLRAIYDLNVRRVAVF